MYTADVWKISSSETKIAGHDAVLRQRFDHAPAQPRSTYLCAPRPREPRNQPHTAFGATSNGIFRFQIAATMGRRCLGDTDATTTGDRIKSQEALCKLLDVLFLYICNLRDNDFRTLVLWLTCRRSGAMPFVGPSRRQVNPSDFYFATSDSTYSLRCSILGLPSIGRIENSGPKRAKRGRARLSRPSLLCSSGRDICRNTTFGSLAEEREISIRAGSGGVTAAARRADTHQLKRIRNDCVSVKECVNID